MRPMDHHDNPQNSINNVIKRDNSNHSSPVPTPSSPPPPLANIRVNSTLRVTTIFDVSRVGKVVAYDSSSNLVTLRK
jgi:hypothetical protein